MNLLYLDKSYIIVLVICIIMLLDVLTLTIIYFTLLSSSKLYVKAGRLKKDAYVPFYNMLVFLQISETPTYYLSLLLLPIINIFIFNSVCFNLSKLFNLDNKFIKGLKSFPIAYLPKLSNGPYIYKEEKKEPLVDVQDQMGLVMTQEDYDKLNLLEEENKVDNVFKGKTIVREEVPTYKAKKRVVIEEVKTTYVNPVNNKNKTEDESDSIDIIEL